MIFVYKLLGILLYPFLILLTYVRIFLKKEDPIRYKEKIFSNSFNTKKKIHKIIWFHAASIGEFKSILPIISRLNIEKNDYHFLITTTTLSSAKLAAKEMLEMKNVTHRFFPYDVIFLIQKFLINWSPKVIFLVDSEIWPNLILESKKRKIPLVLLNARLTKKSFRRWLIFRGIAKKIFSNFNLCISSSSKTQNYLEKLGAKNIYYYGNLKLIASLDKKNLNNINEQFLLRNNFWFAASIHAGEELFCLKTHMELKKKHPKIKTIIAPRHLEKVTSIESLCKILELKIQILNEEELIKEGKEIIIINSFGILNQYYKYAKSVFIGKSLLKKFTNSGGQNPIEAAKLGCKIYHGQYTANFQEIYEILKEKKIARQVISFSDLSKNLDDDFNNLTNDTNDISKTIDNLGDKTLNDTMNKINYIISDAIK